MSFEIVERTPTFGSDKRAVVDTLHPPLVRKMIIGDDWTSIRIGLHWSTRRASNWTGFPGIYVGVCNGTDSPPGVVGCRHFYGFKQSGNGAWVPSRTAFQLLGDKGECLIENGSESLSLMAGNQARTHINGDVANTGASNNPSAFAINIIKGTTWTVGSWSVESNTPAMNASLDYFNDMMGSTTVPTGMTAASRSSFTPDEGTYGALDSICFVFLGGTDPFEVSNIAYTKLA